MPRNSGRQGCFRVVHSVVGEIEDLLKELITEVTTIVVGLTDGDGGNIQGVNSKLATMAKELPPPRSDQKRSAYSLSAVAFTTLPSTSTD